MQHKKLVFVLVTIFMILALVALASAQNTVVIQWDEPQQLDIVGYKLYQRVENEPYDYMAPIKTIEKGNTTTTLCEIPDGSYYFVMKSYDNIGRHSIDSNEIAVILTSDNYPPPPNNVQTTIIIREAH